MKIYIIVSKESKTYGHGDFGQAWEVAMPCSYGSGKPYPAFLSKEEAQTYINTLSFKANLSPMEFEITEKKE